MHRDIPSIIRNLENKKNNELIYKKNEIKKMFLEDPDLLEILGKPEKRPLNKYKDENNPTKEELAKRQEIIDYNEKINHEQIVPYLKLNNTQTEVLNFVMFDIQDDGTSYYNDFIKKQYLIVMIAIHENDMDTEYGIPRADLVDFIIRDLLCWTNALGLHLELNEDAPMIMDTHYYMRRMKFIIKMPNVVNKHGGMWNKYDKFD